MGPKTGRRSVALDSKESKVEGNSLLLATHEDSPSTFDSFESQKGSFDRSSAPFDSFD